MDEFDCVATEFLLSGQTDDHSDSLIKSINCNWELRIEVGAIEIDIV